MIIFVVVVVLVVVITVDIVIVVLVAVNIVGPRYLILEFGQNQVSNSRGIVVVVFVLFLLSMLILETYL